MTWFKVDDSFHSHPKVLAAEPAALGLWVVAGSWSGANLSDGFIPDHVLPRLLPDAASLAQQLVAAGLWKRARGGYRFHDWGDFNPKREEVEEERKAARERMRNLRTKRKGAAQDANGSAEQSANVRDVFVTPTRPDPTRKEGGSSSYVTHDRAHEGPPPSRCTEHLTTPTSGPCRACGDARKARDQWDADRRRRIDAAPTCRIHRGQPAHNCAPCRSERLGADHQEQP
ncbi:hypothetical protein [Micromonospora sp. NPDC005324]|uniref:hypothetical protein n=1 Tax=Micromonospora sp. NPDC005324 TaxID=3157033 RepID=UPI0033B35604